jgi:hypothetical protein
MKRSNLHVVCAIFNPIRWQSRKALYLDFEQHMLDSGVSLTLVECALGDRPFELSGRAHINYIPVRAGTLAWNKENLINLGIQRLPDDAQRIAWLDADIEFRNKDWVMDTLHALEQYPVVQPWSEALDLGPDGAPMLIKGSHVHTSFCKVWRQLGYIPKEPYGYAHPGYAWAARRSTLDGLGGLLETCGLGAADHQMAMSMIGNVVGLSVADTCLGRPRPACRCRQDRLLPGRYRTLLSWRERQTAISRAVADFDKTPFLANRGPAPEFIWCDRIHRQQTCHGNRRRSLLPAAGRRSERALVLKSRVDSRFKRQGLRASAQWRSHRRAP